MKFRQLKKGMMLILSTWDEDSIVFIAEKTKDEVVAPGIRNTNEEFIFYKRRIISKDEWRASSKWEFHEPFGKTTGRRLIELMFKKKLRVH